MTSMSSSSLFSSLDQDEGDIYEQGFDEQFDPPAPDAYECPICLLVLNKPVQTVCGHRFCRGCILKVLREGRPNCPIDNETLNELQIYPDNFARREILSLTVHCHNYKTHGCTWLGELRKLNDHLKDCSFASVLCPNNCGNKVARSEMKEHQENHCPKRIVSCEYCEIKVVFQRFKEHYERCLRFTVECPNNCSVGLIPREELDDHMENNCPKAVVKCTFREFGCNFEGVRETMEKHIESNYKEHLINMMDVTRVLMKTVEHQDCQIKKLQEEAKRDELMDVGTSYNARDGNIYKNEIQRISSKMHDLDIKITQAKTLTEMYRNESQQKKAEFETKIEQINQTVKEQADLVTEMNARVWCGKFIWKITNFDNFFKQAKSADVPAIHSLPFYTGIPGYKMCLRVNLNGIDSGANTHVSMFVHLMQGEFDSVVEWPFPGSVTLTILDQDARGEPQHVKETLTARPSLQAFLRPKSSRNHKGYGYVEMMPHTTLRSNGYIKEDTMIVKVDIKMPPG